MYTSSSTCRVCLVKAEKLVSLFETTGSLSLSEKITVCLKTEITMNDQLPSVICEDCAVELDISYNFIIKCQESNNVLNDYFRAVENYGVPFDSVIVKKEDDLESLEHEMDNGVEWDDADETSEMDNEVLELLNHKKSVKEKKRKSDSKKERKKVKRRRKHSKESLQCSDCGLIAVSRSALIIHFRKHTGEKPYLCTHCDKRFSQKGTMKNHIVNRHMHKPLNLETFGYVCEFCGKCFLRRRDVKIHSRIHTGERPYSCNLCKMSFTQCSSLIRHKRTHTDEKPFTCEKCGKRFADRSMVKMHQIVHSDIRNFSCDICGKAVKTKNTLIKHLSYHTNSKPFICHECAAAFSTKGNLKMHMASRHSEKSGICNVCQKSCSDLVAHLRKHTGEALFECDVCHRRFVTKANFTVHVNKHKNVDKFKCEIDDCKLGFPLKCMLDFHVLKYHKNFTPFVCPDCERGFYRIGDLTNHIRIHHNKTSMKS